MFPEHLQGRWLHHLHGQPIPAPNHSFREEIFPNIQPEFPMAQLEAIPSTPFASYLGEEVNPHLTTTHFQVIVESD